MTTVRDVVALAIQRLDGSTNFTCVAIAGACRRLSNNTKLGYRDTPAVHMWVGYVYCLGKALDTPVFPEWWEDSSPNYKAERVAMLKAWAEKHGDVVLYA